MSTDTGFRAGVARRDLTPANPELLSQSGMGRRAVTFGVLDPLYVEALAMQLDGQLTFLVTSDLLWILPPWQAEIRQKVSQRTGCDPRHILLSSNHTHSASAVMPANRVLAQMPGEIEDNRKKAQAAIDASTRRIIDAFVESCVAAQANLQPAEFAATSTRLKSTMGQNRRMRMGSGTCVTSWGAGPMAPPGEKYVGAAGPDSSDITVAAFRHIGAAAPFAVMTSYGSHIHLYEVPAFSGEVAGACKRNIESRLGGTTAIYAVSPAGNIDMHCVHPMPPGDENDRVRWFQASADLLGRRFAEAVVPAIESLRYLRPARMVHEYFSQGEDSTEVRRLTVINALLLDDVAFLTLPGELFVEFGLQLAAASPARQLLAMTFNGSNSWYIPTPIGLEQGSYEAMRGPARSIDEDTTTAPDGKTIVSLLSHPETGSRIIEQALAMLRRLLGR